MNEDGAGNLVEINLDPIPFSTEVPDIAGVSIGYTFSRQHIQSAFILAKKAVELEASELKLHGENSPSQNVRYEHQAYVIGSLFAAVAFLEALITEVFLEADKISGNPTGSLIQLPSSAVTSMAQIWHSKVVRKGNDVVEMDKSTKSILKTHKNLVTYLKLGKKGGLREDVEKWFVMNKFQLALYLTDINQLGIEFDHEGPLWTDIDLIIRLRNHLVHYKTEEILFPPNKPFQAQSDTEDLIIELTARKFNNHALKNQLVKEISGFILEPVLGSAFAMWAVNSCLSFVCEAFGRASIKVPNPIADLISEQKNVTLFGCSLR